MKKKNAKVETTKFFETKVSYTNEEARIDGKRETFYMDLWEARETLKEMFDEKESIFCDVDGEILELFPKDLRSIIYNIERTEAE